MKRTEYLVIGAGIIGCCSAYYLTKAGAKVIVTDKGFACNEASGVNAGGLDLLQQPKLALPMYREAADLWDRITNEDGVDTEYNRSGGFYVILREEDLHILDAQIADFHEYGIEVYKLDQTEFREMAPYVSEEAIAANYCPVSGFCNPLKAGRNILLAAVSHGTEFIYNNPIERIEPAPEGSGYIAVGKEESIYAEKVLVTCGVRANKLLEPLGKRLGYDIRFNMMSVTEKAPHFLDYTYTTPTLSLKQNAEGSLIIGGGRDGWGDLETNRKDVSINGLSINIAEALALVPSMKKLSILRNWTGIEGFSKDRLPHYGELEQYPGVFFSVSGYCGLTLGPALGLHTARMVLGEEKGSE